MVVMCNDCVNVSWLPSYTDLHVIHTLIRVIVKELRVRPTNQRNQFGASIARTHSYAIKAVGESAEQPSSLLRTDKAHIFIRWFPLCHFLGAVVDNISRANHHSSGWKLGRVVGHNEHCTVENIEVIENRPP